MTSPPGGCPGCAEPLHRAALQSIELHGCVGCGGIWLDNAGCARVAAALLPDAAADLAQRLDAHVPSKTNPYRSAASADRRVRPCPFCGVTLSRTKVFGIELDACRAHGTFFDRHELHAVSQAIAIKNADDDLFVASMKTYGRAGYFR